MSRRRALSPSPGRLLLWTLAALLAAAPAARGDEPAPAGAPAPAPATSPAAPSAAGPAAALDTPLSLRLGDFALPDDAVVDGDTIRLGAAAGNVRVLCVDAEEVFSHARPGHPDPAGEADEKRAKEDFAAYCREKRGASKTPVKFGTPAGVEAQRFAREFFRGVSAVRLERDEVGRDRDGYGRLLAHVLVEKEGARVNFAEALVRAGLSPYFAKYGRSKRFDARFSEAQAEARAAKRGIWGDSLPHYPDYAERLAWWEERAKQVDAWDAGTAAHPDDLARVRLGVEAETARLASLVGQRVTVFGSLERVQVPSDRKDPPPGSAPARGPQPSILWLVDRPHRSFAVVVWSEAVWSAIDRDAAARLFVRATGKVVDYKGRLEMRLDDAADFTAKSTK